MQRTTERRDSCRVEPDSLGAATGMSNARVTQPGDHSNHCVRSFRLKPTSLSLPLYRIRSAVSASSPCEIRSLNGTRCRTSCSGHLTGMAPCRRLRLSDRSLYGRESRSSVSPSPEASTSIALRIRSRPILSSTTASSLRMASSSLASSTRRPLVQPKAALSTSSSVRRAQR